MRLICKDFMLTTATLPAWTDVQQMQEGFGGGHICQRAVKVEVGRGPTIHGGPTLNNGTHPQSCANETCESTKPARGRRVEKDQ